MKAFNALHVASKAALLAGIAVTGLVLAQQKPAEKPPEPPVAGRATLGLTIVETQAVVLGWSVKRDLMGKAVTNDAKERIGRVEDVIIAPKTDTRLPLASFAIVGVGGFLGLATNDVAIPMEQLKLQDGALVLPGATKEALKALPKFEYRRK